MPRPRLVLTGQKFGWLTVVGEAAGKNGRTGLSTWWVLCECGTKKRVVGSHLVTGRIKSCGCGRGGKPVPVEVPEGHSYCWKCRLVKDAKLFYKNKQTKTGLNTRCIECYRKRTPRQQIQIRKKRRERARHLREEVIAHYGGECACCGDKTFEFLAVRAYRKRVRTGNMSGWLKKNHYPKGFRVLCHNCYTAKSEFRCCPHEEKIVVG